MTTIYFAGGEDSEHFPVGGATVTTTANTFRSTYARCALQVASAITPYWQNKLQYVGTPSTFWFTARMTLTSGFTATLNSFLMKFLDGAGLPRLRIKCSVAGVAGTNVFIVEKVNTAGTATTLTNTLAAWSLVPSGVAITDQLAINWVNAVSGSVDVYYNGNHVYNFSGDTTTETTTIASHQLFIPTTSGNLGWSEIIVTDVDARNLNLQTLAPVANGNTHNFDTGTPAAANVNDITNSDATLDGSTTAGQIDEYTIPAIATGTYSILAVGVSARMSKGATGPSKADLAVRSSGTDYFSADQTLTAAWDCYQNWWTSDPAGGGWGSLPVNIGIKSVT